VLINSLVDQSGGVLDVRTRVMYSIHTIAYYKTYNSYMESLNPGKESVDPAD
jgi:hypothetical protein